MSSFLTFLWASLLVGTFSFGGGKAYIPVFKSIYVDQFSIISNLKLTELVGYAVALPGPIATKITAVVGFEQFGIEGFILGLLSLTVFPLLLFLFVWGIYKRYSDNQRVNSIANYLSPVIIALLLSVCLSLFVETRPSSDVGNHIYDIYFALIFIVCSLILIKTETHPVLLIIASGFLGFYIL